MSGAGTVRDAATGLRILLPGLELLADPGVPVFPVPRDAEEIARRLEGDPPSLVAARDEPAALAGWCAGIHPPEPDGTTWTGPSLAAILYRPREAVALVLKAWVPPELLRDGPATLELWLAGERVLRRTVREEGILAVAAPLPGTPATGDFPVVPVRWTWDRSFRPADLGTSPDVRELACVFEGTGFVDGAGRPLRGEPAAGPVGPLPTLLPGLHGRCLVCGDEGMFLLEPGVALNQSFPCPRCRSFSRWRMLARGLLRFLAARGWRAHSLAELRDTPPGEPVRILDTCSAWPPARLLRGLPGIDLVVSEYDPDVPPGAELAPGVRCENLEALTLADESVDVVLTGDVLEHVRLYHRALREIFRVLRPGGEFLFTVPHVDGTRHEIYREVVDPDDPSRDRDLRPPVYHADTRSEGSLVYRVYGRQRLLDELRETGFLVAFERRTIPRLALPHQELFRAVKPASPAPGPRGDRG